MCRIQVEECVSNALPGACSSTPTRERSRIFGEPRRGKRYHDSRVSASSHECNVRCGQACVRERSGTSSGSMARVAVDRFIKLTLHLIACAVVGTSYHVHKIWRIPELRSFRAPRESQSIGISITVFLTLHYTTPLRNDTAHFRLPCNKC
jgi:hypothetical protein